MRFFKGSRNTYVAVLSADILAFISGTSMAWSSPVLPILENNDLDNNPLGRKITQVEESWIGSLAALGGIFGPFIFGHLIQIINRKLTLTSVAVPFLLAYLLAAFAKTVELYYVSRILMGLANGGMFCTVPIYVAETAEIVNRGLLQASVSSSVMFGLLFSYCLGPFVSILTFNLVLSAICIVYVPIFWFLAPETPYYLILTGKIEEATKSLQYLRNSQSNEEAVAKELDDIKNHLEKFVPGSYSDIFKTKATIRAFIYIVSLVIFQQFSGTTVFSYYTQNIFDSTGSDIAPEICAIIVGFVQFLISSTSPPFLDKIGRRPLLLVPIVGATIAQVLLGVYFYLQDNGYDVSDINWLPVFSLVLYMVFSNFGMGAIPWVLMGELLPLHVKSKAALLTTSVYWLVGFFLTKYFGDLSNAIGMAGSFWFFAGFCVFYDIFVYFFIFETKGKSFAEIQDILSR